MNEDNVIDTFKKRMLLCLHSNEPKKRNFMLNHTPQKNFSQILPYHVYVLCLAFFLFSCTSTIDCMGIRQLTTDIVIPELLSIESKAEVISSKIEDLSPVVTPYIAPNNIKPLKTAAADFYLIPSQQPIQYGSRTPYTPLLAQLITVPGSYFLNENVNANITINTDETTLDLNEFIVTGSIQLNGNRSKITIKNGTVVGNITVIGPGSCNNVLIENIVISGNINLQDGNINNWTIRECEIESGISIYPSSGAETTSSNIRISNSTINNGNIDLSLSSGSSNSWSEVLIENVAIKNGGIQYNGMSGISEHAISNLTIKECPIAAGYIAIQTDTIQNQNIRITNCSIQATSADIDKQGIYLALCDNVDIKGTTVKNSDTTAGNTLFSFSECTNGSLTNCIAIGDTINSIGFGFGATISSNFSLAWCTAQQHATGFSLGNTQKTELKHCVAETCVRGFSLSNNTSYADNVVLEKCIATGCTFAGFYNSGSSGTSTIGIVRECIAEVSSFGALGFDDTQSSANNTVVYVSNIARSGTSGGVNPYTPTVNAPFYPTLLTPGALPDTGYWRNVYY